MKKVEVKFAKRKCTLEDCPPGLFLYKETIGFKSEYGAFHGEDIGMGQVKWTITGNPDVYCAESGEKFWGGCKSQEELSQLKVRPMV